jgi:hypothetical protein
LSRFFTISFLVLTVLTLVGCSKAAGTYENVEVISNIERPTCARCGEDRTITIKKDGDIVELVAYEGDGRQLKKGNTVNVTYDENYRVIEVTVPSMEGDSVEK